MASKIKVDQILGSTGSTITVPTGQTFTLTDGLAVASLPTVTVAKGGTNLTSFTAGDVLYATGSTTLAKLAKGSDDDVLTLASGLPSWAAASAGGGKLLQVQSTHVSAASTITTGAHTGGWGAYGTFITCAITPTLNTSKILVLYQLGWGFEQGYAIHLGRDDANGDVEIGLADASDNRNRALTGSHNYETHSIQRFAGQYLDSPAIATAITYEMKVSSNSATSWYLNRSVADRDNVLGYDPRGVSNLTVMEIGV